MGERPDPYRVWLSEIMLQQTTVATVQAYFLRFTDAWPDVHALASAPAEDVLAAWAGLGYYARARNLIRCAQLVSRELGGVFPDDMEALRELPGIGPYTAGAIAAIAFDKAATVVDGNVERVMARLFAVEDPLPSSKRQLRAYAKSLTPDTRPGDYAQAVMDLGATICKPRRPDCGHCPWSDACMARAQGIESSLPKKAPKRAKPVRHGHVWALFDSDGRVATVRRPNKGLLGGMLALPSSNWGTQPDPRPPFLAEWEDVGEVRHTFTHFHLVLRVHRAHGPVTEMLPQAADKAIGQMPTVFAKALNLAMGSADDGTADGN